MYQIIDFESKKYTNGGIGSKESAESLNEKLKSVNLKLLGILEILSEEDKPNSCFEKSNIFDISQDVYKRIQQKQLETK